MPVNGSDRASFHYDLDVDSTPVDGTIDLVSTGRVGSVTRSIEVTLRRGGFGEFLYATTYETTDPAEYAHPDEVYAQCAKYYSGRPPGMPGHHLHRRRQAQRSGALQPLDPDDRRREHQPEGTVVQRPGDDLRPVVQAEPAGLQLPATATGTATEPFIPASTRAWNTARRWTFPRAAVT